MMSTKLINSVRRSIDTVQLLIHWYIDTVTVQYIYVKVELLFYEMPLLILY